MATELLIVDAGEFAAVAARTVVAALRAAVQAEGRCALALAGGGTPKAVYERLAAGVAGTDADLWRAVDVYFGDERCVPPDDPESNWRMAWETLLSRVPVTPERLHRMRGEMADREGAAREYEAALPAQMDVLLLGIGEDGHTASLFPGHAALAERERRVMAVTGPKPPPWRLTITPPVIAAARRRVVLATGAGKANAVRRALRSDDAPAVTPAVLARDGVWILDEAGATGLG